MVVTLRVGRRPKAPWPGMPWPPSKVGVVGRCEDGAWVGVAVFRPAASGSYLHLLRLVFDGQTGDLISPMPHPHPPFHSRT